MNRWVAMFVFFYLGSFSAYAQNNSTINVETGLFYSYGQYNNPIINIGDYHDQIYFIIGYQKVNPQFNYSVRLGLMEDNLTEEFEGSQNSESAFFGWRSWSPIGKKTILFELQTTVKWLNNKSKLLPLLDIGISTLILAQKTGGGTSIGDSKSIYQILGEYEYKRKVNPFLIAGIQYKFFDNPSYSIPLRFGYRIPIFSSYQTASWTIIDRIKNQTQFKQGKKNGFASYFTIGLEFKL